MSWRIVSSKWFYALQILQLGLIDGVYCDSHFSDHPALLDSNILEGSTAITRRATVHTAKSGSYFNAITCRLMLESWGPLLLERARPLIYLAGNVYLLARTWLERSPGLITPAAAHRRRWMRSAIFRWSVVARAITRNVRKARLREKIDEQEACA